MAGGGIDAGGAAAWVGEIAGGGIDEVAVGEVCWDGGGTCAAAGRGGGGKRDWAVFAAKILSKLEPPIDVGSGPGGKDGCGIDGWVWSGGWGAVKELDGCMYWEKDSLP